MLTDEQINELAANYFKPGNPLATITLFQCREFARAILAASAGQAELIDALNLLREIVDEGLSTSRMKRARAILASAGQVERKAIDDGTIIAAIERACGAYRTNDSYSFEDVWNCIEAAFSLAAPTPAAAQAVRVCEISDIECSRGCGVGDCKREREARYPVERPAAAHTYTTTGTGCDRCGRALSEHREGRYCPAEQTAAARDERGAFEAAWRRQYPEHTATFMKSCIDSERYVNTRVQDGWLMWQARAAASPVSGAALTVLTDEFPTEDCPQRRFLLEVSNAMKRKHTHLLLSTIHEVLLAALAEIERGERAGGGE
jgi:hypothetical protein